MMNAMTQALKSSGAKLPSVKFRIWHWLKDHPEKTTDDIMKALGLSYSPSPYLIDMEKAGVLKVYSDVSHRTTGLGTHPKIKRYSVTNPNDFDAPLRKVYTSEKRGINVAPIVKAAPPAPKVKPTPTGLTEAEKFAAYLEFKALMKEMK